jgi:hypothetical protein
MGDQETEQETVDNVDMVKKKKFFAYVGILSIYYLFGVLMYTYGVESWSFTGELESPISLFSHLRFDPLMLKV